MAPRSAAPWAGWTVGSRPQALVTKAYRFSQESQVMVPLVRQADRK
jgi:hypothetical protein